MSFIQVKNISKSFMTPGGRIVNALSDVSFTAPQGCILSIIGHNGSGKSTLLNVIRNSLCPDSGSILIDGEDYTKCQGRVVSVYQDVSFGVVPSMTAMENMALVWSSQERGFLWAFPTKRHSREIKEFLREAELLKRFEAFEQTPVSEISGGQRQQLALVMAMMRKPSILLLDEFEASLDPITRDDVLSWTKAWVQKNGVTTIMVTHDHVLAKVWGNAVLELENGRVKQFSNI